ncbi:MAG: CoA ester lyase [Acidimicrobiales bacterium]
MAQDSNLLGFRYPASYLFVPATRLDRVEKALATNAHEVIVDLEDAVAADEKDRARDDLATFSPSRPVHIRVNARATPFFEADLGVIAALGWVSGVVLPKTESGDDGVLLRDRLESAVARIALVESAIGIEHANEIARSGFARMMFGVVDYTADLGISASEVALLYPRSRLVVASAASSIAAPVDGPTTAVGDLRLLTEEARHARSIGFGGKLCIHPAQVDAVNDAFRAADHEIARARAVVAEFERRGGGVFLLDGEMVDQPVVTRARQLLGST